MAPEAAAVAFHHFYLHSKVHQKYETCVRSLAFVQAGRGVKMASEAAAATHGAWVAWGSGPLPSTCTLFEKLNFCPKIQ